MVIAKPTVTKARQAVVMLSWIGLLWLVVPSMLAAEGEATFRLCPPDVQQTMIEAQKDHRWSVYVQLTTQGAQRFEAFTQANLGKIGRVVVGDRVFFRARIQVPVSSGTLQATFTTRKRAQAWQRMLTENQPGAPCGMNNEPDNALEKTPGRVKAVD